MEENTTVKSNLDICPNCLEPNRSDLANCEFCGMPLHPDAAAADEGSSVSTDTAETSIVSDGTVTTVETSDEAPAASEIPAEKPKKKENKGWSYAMRGFGIYIIFYAVSEGVRHFKLEPGQERRLGLISDVIYLVAGCLMAWPLLKDFLAKRKEKQANAMKAAGEQTIDGTEVSSPAESDEDVIDAERAAETMIGDETSEMSEGEGISEIESSVDPNASETNE